MLSERPQSRLLRKISQLQEPTPARQSHVNWAGKVEEPLFYVQLCALLRATEHTGFLTVGLWAFPEENINRIRTYETTILQVEARLQPFKARTEQ